MDDRILYLEESLNADLSELYLRIDCHIDDYRIYFEGDYVTVDAQLNLEADSTGYDVIEISDIQIHTQGYLTTEEINDIMKELNAIFDIINNYHGSLLMM